MLAMLQESTPFEQFSTAESQILQLLGKDADERLFELSTWESADRNLLGLFPAISSALSVLSEEPKLRRGSATPETQRSSPCSTSDCASTSDASSFGASLIGALSFGASSSCASSASPRSSAERRASPPAVQRPPARWCRPGFKDLQLLVSREDVASIPRATSIEEVLALLSKDDVIVVPTHGGAILYEVTYLDDLVTQQPATVIPPTPDDPATQLSPEVFNFFLQNEELLAQCQDSTGLVGAFLGADAIRNGLFC